MKTVFRIAALALCLSAFTAAQAESTPYAGISVARVQYKEDGFPKAEPSAISFKYGVQFNPNFAVETRLGTGLSDGDVNISGIPVSVGVESFIGIYLKGIIPVGNRFAPYAMVGYTNAKLKLKSGAFSDTASDSDFSYGAGADFPVSKNVSLNLEVARLFTGDGYKVDAVSLGATYKF